MIGVGRVDVYTHEFHTFIAARALATPIIRRRVWKPPEVGFYPLHHFTYVTMAPRSTKESGLASLACTECRKQHLKCDAHKPSCSRCLRNGYFCQYLPSRRGGRRKANRRAPSSSSLDQINNVCLPNSLSCNTAVLDDADRVPGLSDYAHSGASAAEYAGQFVAKAPSGGKYSHRANTLANDSSKGGLASNATRTNP